MARKTRAKARRLAKKEGRPISTILREASSRLLGGRWRVDHRQARTWGPPEGNEPPSPQIDVAEEQEATAAPLGQVDVAQDQQAGSAPAQGAPDQSGSGQSTGGVA